MFARADESPFAGQDDMSMQGCGPECEWRQERGSGKAAERSVSSRNENERKNKHERFRDFKRLPRSDKKNRQRIKF